MLEDYWQQEHNKLELAMPYYKFVWGGREQGWIFTSSLSKFPEIKIGTEIELYADNDEPMSMKISEFEGIFASNGSTRISFNIERTNGGHFKK